MAQQLNPSQFKARIAAGAPLAKGVKGRTEATMNMTPEARSVADMKTKVRAERKALGAKGTNIVTRSSGVVTGSTSKTSKFTVKPRRVK